MRIRRRRQDESTPSPRDTWQDMYSLHFTCNTPGPRTEDEAVAELTAAAKRLGKGWEPSLYRLDEQDDGMSWRVL